MFSNTFVYIHLLIKVMIFSKSYCPFCDKVKNLFKSLNIEFTAVELDQVEEGDEMQKVLEERYDIFLFVIVVNPPCLGLFRAHVICSAAA